MDPRTEVNVGSAKNGELSARKKPINQKMSSFQSLQKISAAKLARFCCDALDDPLLEVFAQQVTACVANRGMNLPWNIPAERTAQLLKLDGEQPFHGMSSAQKIGEYPGVRDWQDVANAIIADDNPWQLVDFCAMVHHHFRSVEWPGLVFSRELEHVSPDVVEDDWLEWPELNEQEFRRGSELMRSFARRKPNELLNALKGSRYEINSWFIGFLDEEWHVQLECRIE